MDRAELLDRLYRAGGPKHGLRQRQDAIDTLWRSYTYLRLRAQLEGSGDFATTAEQTIVGLSFELIRRGAKAWDPAIGSGLRGKARREELLRRRGSALTKLLNELAGAGVLVWGGERDNHGMWWRLRIRLLDADEESRPDWEPWMRGVEPPEKVDTGSCAGEEDDGDSGRPKPSARVNLASLYRRVEALTGQRPQPRAHQVVQLRHAVERFAANAGYRPPGARADALDVLLAQVEHFAPRDETGLAWALVRFDGYTRQLEARGGSCRTPQTDPAKTPQPSVSPNCAALFNQQLNPNVSEISALACRTGARGPVDEMHDAPGGTVAEQGPGMGNSAPKGRGSRRNRSTSTRYWGASSDVSGGWRLSRRGSRRKELKPSRGCDIGLQELHCRSGC